MILRCEECIGNLRNMERDKGGGVIIGVEATMARVKCIKKVISARIN